MLMIEVNIDIILTSYLISSVDARNREKCFFRTRVTSKPFQVKINTFPNHLYVQNE